LRSFDAAGKAGTVGDLFRIYALSLRSQAGFNWVTMPGDVSLKGETVFDPVLMGRLYELGLEKGRAGDFWSNTPPGMEP